ncbi:MAG: BatA domain-containing protein [Pseudomonadota bacterium]
MISLWWLGLALLAFPIWWHRQRRERISAKPLATARFLPRTDPQQQRVWRWVDRALLLVRCLLLAAVVAWLADLVIPWRGSTVLVVPGTDSAWARQQGGEQLMLPTADAFGWLALHEREFQDGARLTIIGDVAMPAVKPRFSHVVEVRSRIAPRPQPGQRIVVVSKRAAKWQALFGATGYRHDAEQSGKAALVVWDVPEAPPAGLQAPLWWVGDATAFPELVAGRHANSARGRLWAMKPAATVEEARTQFETWQQLHYPPVPYATAPITLAAASGVSPRGASGALRYLLTIALIALFALERTLTHARRR